MGQFEFEGDLNITCQEDIEAREENPYAELFYLIHDALCQKIARLRFVEKRSIREVAAETGIPKSTCHRHLLDYTRRAVQVIKQDLKTNKMFLDHMIELMEEIKFRVREHHMAYADYGRELKEMKRDVSRLKKDKSKSKIRMSSETLQLQKLMLEIHDRRRSCLDLLQTETRALLDVWYKFGLCDNESVKLLLDGEIYYETKIEEVKTFLIRMIHILKEELVELNDEGKKHKIFTRLINEIKNSGLYGKRVGGDAGTRVVSEDEAI